MVVVVVVGGGGGGTSTRKSICRFSNLIFAATVSLGMSRYLLRPAYHIPSMCNPLSKNVLKEKCPYHNHMLQFLLLDLI